MPKFIHAADIHLDSPMRGLANYPGAPIEEVRGATRKALEALVDLALEEAVDLVVIAGDLYDGDWRDYHTGLYLAAQMTRLRSAGVRVVTAAGNHDAASQITRHLKLPDNVVQLSTRAPQTVAFEEFGLAVHGQGFAERHVAQNVVPLYPAPRSDLFNIGLLHTSAGYGGHEEYAPCSKEDLLARGYQYWALGHVHRAEVLSERPWIAFPGNLQGRQIRETGPKGCLLVTVDGESVRVEPRELAIVRWEWCRVAGDGCRDGFEVLERMGCRLEELLGACEAPVLAVRVAIEGDFPARASLLAAPERWLNEARQLATDLSAARVWLEKLEVEEPPGAAAAESPLDGSALALLQALALTAEDVTRLGEDADLRDLLARLPRELTEEAGCAELCAETLARLAPRARALLVEAVEKGGEDE